jgi:WD40 repeat protein
MHLFKGKGSAVTGLAFSPDGGTLAAGSSSRVDFWDVAAGKGDALTLGIWGVPPDNVRFDPSGKWLLVGLGLQRGLHVVEVRTGGVRQVGHGAPTGPDGHWDRPARSSRCISVGLLP